jgi:hypothetical protein
MLRTISILAILFLSLAGYSQSVIRGVLRDSQENRFVPNATVQLFQPGDSLPFKSVISRGNGRFQLMDIIPGNYRIRISTVGFESIDSLVDVRDSVLDLRVINLAKSSKVLDEVIFKATAPPVKQKNDTLEYSANSFKVNPDANVEDLVKKMPGITVENGAVKAGGEDVRKVTIDGRDFLAMMLPLRCVIFLLK